MANNIFINLETVHKQMEAKYLINAELEKDKKDAREIQRVLRKINKEFLKENSDLISNETYKSIVNNIKIQHPRLKGLFKTSSGSQFEKNIFYILEGIVNSVIEETGQKINTNSILSAKQTGTTFNLEDFESEVAQQVLQQSGVKAEAYLKENDSEKKLFLKKIQRKSDIEMVNVDIDIQETNELLNIYNLLKGATFSLKNYDSNLKQYAKDWWTQGLKLGGANFARSIGASLSSLGYSSEDIFKLLVTKQEKYQTDKNIQNHFDHLAFIYELTGAGMKLKNNKLEFTKFIIFNDPSGQLVVRSSRELLQRMFNTQMLISENINGKKYYTIRRSVFR